MLSLFPISFRNCFESRCSCMLILIKNLRTLSYWNLTVSLKVPHRINAIISRISSLIVHSTLIQATYKGVCWNGCKRRSKRSFDALFGKKLRSAKEKWGTPSLLSLVIKIKSHYFICPKIHFGEGESRQAAALFMQNKAEPRKVFERLGLSLNSWSLVKYLMQCPCNQRTINYKAHTMQCNARLA